MKSTLLLKVLSFIMAGSVLVGGGVLAGMTLAPQREAANLIPTAVVGGQAGPNQPVPANDNMNMNTAVSPQSSATGMSGNQMGATPNPMSPGQPGYGMQGNGNMNMDMNDNWNNQMSATPNAMPTGQTGYNMQGNDNMGMGGNWEMNGRDNWGVGSDMRGNGNMGMGNGMNNQGYAASLTVTTLDEAAQAVQAYLA